AMASSVTSSAVSQLSSLSLHDALPIFSETALLLLACNSIAAQYTDISSRLQKIARLLIPHARNEEIIIRMCLNPGLAYDYAFARSEEHTSELQSLTKLVCRLLLADKHT